MFVFAGVNVADIFMEEFEEEAPATEDAAEKFDDAVDERYTDCVDEFE